MAAAVGGDVKVGRVKATAAVGDGVEVAQVMVDGGLEVCGVSVAVGEIGVGWQWAVGGGGGGRLMMTYAKAKFKNYYEKN